jgi:hypothetical protein
MGFAFRGMLKIDRWGLPLYFNPRLCPCIFDGRFIDLHPPPYSLHLVSFTSKPYLNPSPWLVSRLLGANLRGGTEIPMLLRWVWLEFCVQWGFRCASSVWMNKSHFLTWLLCLWTLFTQVLCVPGILQFRKPKCCRIFKTPFFEKKWWTITYEKYHFLLDMNFLAKWKTNLPSNFTWRKECLSSTEGCQGCWGFGGQLPKFGATGMYCCFRDFV